MNLFKLLTSQVVFAALFVLFSQAAFGMSGGTIAKAGEWPFSIGIKWMLVNTPKRCSGTFVKANLIITAAHCIVDLNRGTQLEAFTNGLEHNSLSAVVKRSAYNPDFVVDESKEIFFNDIGYIELTTNLGDKITGGQYPSLSNTVVHKGATLTFVGSGIDREFNIVPGYEPTTKKWSEFQCGGRQKDLFVLMNHSRTSFCDVDSGGGAYRKLADGTYELTGVLALSNGACGSAEGYGALHDITFSRAWLESSLGYSL